MRRFCGAQMRDSDALPSVAAEKTTESDSMLIPQYDLLGFGGMTLFFGFAYLLVPAFLSEAAGFGSMSTTATTDVRATHGGFWGGP
jgi:hypothetical protein